MKNIIVSEAFELLKETGICANESEFSEYWLGHSDCYLRTLRFKRSEPSLGSLAICGVRLQNAGEQMLGSRRYKKLGVRLIEMGEKFNQQVNEQCIELELTE